MTKEMTIRVDYRRKLLDFQERLAHLTFLEQSAEYDTIQRLPRCMKIKGVHFTGRGCRTINFHMERELYTLPGVFVLVFSKLLTYRE